MFSRATPKTMFVIPDQVRGRLDTFKKLKASEEIIFQIITRRRILAADAGSERGKVKAIADMNHFVRLI